MDAKAGRLGLVVLACGAIFAPSTASAGMSATSGGAAQAASSGCKSEVQGEPCLGPLHSSYSYAGLGGGDLGYLWAKLGPRKVVGTTFMKEPYPRQYQIYRRLFTWHSRPDVTIVAAFARYSIHHGHGYRLQRLPSGPHSGHVTLNAIEDATPPLLLLQGRKDAHASAAARLSTPCYVREVPCLGRVQLLYAFGGKRGGALSSIHVAAGPTEADGSTPDGKPIQRRSLSWKSVSGVQLVAAFVLRSVVSGGKGHWRIQRLSTGPSGGHTTLSTEPDNPFPEPLLLLEGRRTRGE